MTTIRDIARLAGVSVSTASLALNGSDRVRRSTRQKVLDAARSLDYTASHSARSLGSGRTWHLHLINPISNHGRSSSFLTSFVHGVHKVVHRHDYTLALSALNSESEAEAELDKLIRERRSDGVILMNVSDELHLLQQLLDRDFPHVLLGYSPLDNVNSVDSDNEAVGRDATTHLLQRGRKRILFLNAPAQHAFAQSRARGYRVAHAEAAIEVDEELLRFGLTTVPSARAETARMLRDCPDFDGVLASSDEVAIGALRALREAGRRVPEDAAIVGMNNDELADYTEPRLTSVELNPGDLGHAAAQLLLNSIANGPPERRLVRHCIITRESA